MHSSEKLLINRVEVELLLLDHDIKHPMLFHKGFLSFDLSYGSLEDVFLLVLQLDDDWLLGFSRWHLFDVSVELLGLVEKAASRFEVHNCPQLEPLNREVVLPQRFLVHFQKV